MGNDVARLLGLAIRRNRVGRGWTQHHLGLIVYCSQTRISKIERGVVRIDAAEREAFEDAFGLQRGSLLREIGRVDAGSTAHEAEELVRRIASLENSVLALRQVILRHLVPTKVNDRHPLTGAR